MATNYTFYLMAYGQGGEARTVVDQYNISTPSSHGQLAAHALGLSDWRDGSPPRACAEVDAKLTELLRPRPGVNVGGVKMGEMTEVLRNIASEADRVAGGSGVPGEVSAANTSRPWCGGRVEEKAHIHFEDGEVTECRVDHKRLAAEQARDVGRSFLADKIPPVSQNGPGAEQVVAGLLLALDSLLGP